MLTFNPRQQQAVAFKLANGGKELDDKEVERSAAMKGIMGWVRLHPYNIAQKVQIVVEHFRELVAPLLNGRGKAMVVVASPPHSIPSGMSAVNSSLA